MKRRTRFECRHFGFGAFCHRCRNAERLVELVSNRQVKGSKYKSREEVLREAARLYSIDGKPDEDQYRKVGLKDDGTLSGKKIMKEDPELVQQIAAPGMDVSLDPVYDIAPRAKRTRKSVKPVKSTLIAGSDTKKDEKETEQISQEEKRVVNLTNKIVRSRERKKKGEATKKFLLG